MQTSLSGFLNYDFATSESIPLANKAAITIPFQLADGLITMEVTVNGTGPYRVGLDTGGILSLSPRLAVRLGLPNEGAEDIVGSGGNVTPGYWTTVDALGIGDFILPRQRALVFGDTETESVYGIGCEVFQNFVVQINYQRKHLRLFSPEAFQYDGIEIVLPLEFAGDAPLVSGEVDGITGKFLMDTASVHSLVLFTPFCERHGLYTRYFGGTEGVVAQGIGGSIRGRIVRAGTLRLGTMTVEQPVTILAQMQSGAFAEPHLAGNIGQGILRRFLVTFDYARQRMILEPSAEYR